MRRALTILALGVLAAPATAHAQSSASGGTTPPEAAVAPVAGGSAPGGLPAGARPAAPASNAATGGNPYGRTFQIPPVIRSFSATPAGVTWGGAPTRLQFRVDATNLRSVRVVLDVRAKGARTARRIALGVQPTGRSLTRTWTRDGIDPGTYYLALRVVDARGRSLAQAASASITVRVKPTPKPAPAPVPVPAPSPSPAPSGSGVFPVRGPVTWGDGFGVNRGDHIHNGQDLAAASGTPLVSPRRGTVVAAGYGAGSGYYVVVKDADRDVSYVFFHMLAGSIVVSNDQSVAAGQRVGSVGSTGNSSGPHLHFEVWAGAWWGGGHSVDPAPYLRSWS